MKVTNAIVFAAALLAALRVHAAPQVVLPLEAIGKDGTTASCQFTMPAGVDPTTVTRLWLKTHGVRYAGKAQVRLNSGPWVQLDNSTATFEGQGGLYGGIGGEYSVLRMTVAVGPGVVHSGTNTLQLMMVHTDYVSIAVRLLAFNLRNAAGTDLLPASMFSQDDPSVWRPPSTARAEIAAGELLWRTKELRQSSLSVAPLIKARCGDCHAKDGRDLKYFNFSNLSIVERCKFHGMTSGQGAQVASYIRSLPGPAPGRPWNPPYQPGPGVDSKPQSWWAAGAGEQAVLDNDRDMAPLLLPTGPSDIATSKTLNLRELRIPFLLPDWDSWLPRIHPMDAFGADFTGSAAWTMYATMNGRLASMGAAAYTANNGSLPQVYYNMCQIGRDRATKEGALRALARLLISRVPLADWDQAFTQRLYSLFLWDNVKSWEQAQVFGLESQGTNTYGAQSEAGGRTWYGQQFFITAPGIIGIPFTAAQGVDGSKLNNTYLTNVWYLTQVITNPGDRHANSTTPFDVQYYLGVLKAFDTTLGTGHTYTQAMYLAKSMQEQNNGVQRVGIGRGWDPAHVGDISGIGDPGNTAVWNGSTAAQKTYVMEALYTVWLSNNLLFTPAQFYADGETSADEADVYPAFVTKVKLIIRYGDQNHLSAPLMSSMRAWAATVWPSRSW